MLYRPNRTPESAWRTLKPTTNTRAPADAPEANLYHAQRFPFGFIILFMAKMCAQHSHTVIFARRPAQFKTTHQEDMYAQIAFKGSPNSLCRLRLVACNSKSLSKSFHNNSNTDDIRHTYRRQVTWAWRTGKSISLARTMRATCFGKCFGKNYVFRCDSAARTKLVTNVASIGIGMLEFEIWLWICMSNKPDNDRVD